MQRNVEQKQNIFAREPACYAPEQPERDLEDAGEEGDGEDDRPVGHRVGSRVDHVLDHRRQQQRDHGDGADGDLPRRPHDSVDQRWHDARVFGFVHKAAIIQRSAKTEGNKNGMYSSNFATPSRSFF
jgi:hypothetical protein